MKILVCTKHVLDTEAKLKVASDGKSPDLGGAKMIISPFDEYALEEALLIKEAGGATEVVALCLGDESSQASLRQALAMGADRAIHIVDRVVAGADPLSRARLLAAAIRDEAPELVFTGKTGVGDDEGQVGPMLGELLDRPHASGVTELAVASGRFTAHRDIEGAVEIVEGELPALIAWNKGEHPPRYPSLKGIMAAKKKPFTVRTAAELGVPPSEALIVREELALPAARAAGRILTGDPTETTAELARLLRDEAKVI